MQAGRRGVDRRARKVGANAAQTRRRSRQRFAIDRILRRSCAYRDRRHHGPFLVGGPLPSAHQRLAADPHACGVLHLQVEQVALVEVGEPALSAQVQPVLRSPGRGCTL